MGSFSWNRADKVKRGEPENIYGGYHFKCLIPKEFGGGFLSDFYRDYGDVIDERTKKKYDLFEVLAFWNREQVKPRSTSSTVVPMDLSVGATVRVKCSEELSHYTDDLTYAYKTLEIKRVFTDLKDGKMRFALVGACDVLFTREMFVDTTKYVQDKPEGLLCKSDFYPYLPELSKFTCHNRVLGIYACSEEVEEEKKDGRRADQAEFLKYPLKLVSYSYEGTYEDCDGFSTHDPDQGFFPRKHHG